MSSAASRGTIVRGDVSGARGSHATVYYLGITAHESSGNALFPAWCRRFGVDARLQCVNLPKDSAPERYHEFMTAVRRDPQAVGLLVTCHKAALHEHCEDAFETLTSDARTLREVGMGRIVDGRVHGDAHDVPALRAEVRRLLGDERWRDGGREVLIMGAGGAGLALARTLYCDADDVGRIVVTERSSARRMLCLSLIHI